MPANHLVLPLAQRKTPSPPAGLKPTQPSLRRPRGVFPALAPHANCQSPGLLGGSTSWPSKSRDAYAKGLLARVQSLLPGRGGLWECLDIKPHKGLPQSLRGGCRTPGILHPQPPREGPSLLVPGKTHRPGFQNPKVGSPAQPGMDKREAGH